MKFDVIKWLDDTNHSCVYAEWCTNVHEMMNMLDGEPTYDQGEHYWTFVIHKWKKLDIGFRDDGTLFCRYRGPQYKDPEKFVLSSQQVNLAFQTFMNVLSIFDKFGYIIPSKDIPQISHWL